MPIKDQAKGRKSRKLFYSAVEIVSAGLGLAGKLTCFGCNVSDDYPNRRSQIYAEYAVFGVICLFSFTIALSILAYFLLFALAVLAAASAVYLYEKIADKIISRSAPYTEFSNTYQTLTDFDNCPSKSPLLCSTASLIVEQLGHPLYAPEEPSRHISSSVVYDGVSEKSSIKSGSGVLL